MSELEIFASAGNGLDLSHFGLTDEGVAYVVAGPFAKAMGYRDAEKATRLLDEAEKGTQIVGTPGGDQRVSVIYEDGIWELIFRSTLPSARSLKAQVKEILRQLRQTGVVDMRSQKELTRREILQMALDAEDRAEAAEAKVAELEPKADLADTYLISDGSQRLVREAAKLLGMKEKELRRFLLDERLIFPKHAPCGDVSYDFYADFAHHFVAKETVVNHTWGSCSHYTLRITARGIELIKKRLAGRDAA